MSKTTAQEYVNNNITTNGTQSITGAVMNSALTQVIDAITKEDVGLGNVPNVDATVAANITQDATHRFVTDSEKSDWNSKQSVGEKDASNGYVGLTLFKINIKNVLGTITSFFTNSNTAQRTYTFQDRNGTIADDTDLAAKEDVANKSTNVDTDKASNTKYPSVKAVYDWAVALFLQTGETGALKSLTITGTNGDGHIHLKHQASDATSTASSTTVFADSNGDLKYKIDGNYYTTLKTSLNTANRVYTYPDEAVTLAGITQTITNGDTTKAPSGDAVYDALSNKQDKLIGQAFTTGPVTEAAGTTIYRIDTSLSAINYQTLNTNTTARYVTIQNISGLNLISISSPSALTFNGAATVTLPAIDGAIATLIFDGTAATDIKVIFSIPTNVVKLLSVATATTFDIPAGYMIENIAIENTTANAVTGGIKWGTTLGGVDVIAAQTVGSNALLVVDVVDILLKIFSTSSTQTIYIDAVTAWNAASLNISISLKKLL